MAISGYSLGSVLVFEGTIGPFPPPAVVEQPPAERLLGFPQVLGLFAAVQGNITPEQGVPVNELNQ